MMLMACDRWLLTLHGLQAEGKLEETIKHLYERGQQLGWRAAHWVE
jgi:hypothetical protein